MPAHADIPRQRTDLSPGGSASAVLRTTALAAFSIDLADQALAASSGAGFRFDPGGRSNHLFDLRTGTCAGARSSVSVLAPTATAADALATACCLLPIDRIASRLRAAGAGHEHDGRRHRPGH